MPQAVASPDDDVAEGDDDDDAPAVVGDNLRGAGDDDHHAHEPGCAVLEDDATSPREERSRYGARVRDGNLSTSVHIRRGWLVNDTQLRVTFGSCCSWETVIREAVSRRDVARMQGIEAHPEYPEPARIEVYSMTPLAQRHVVKLPIMTEQSTVHLQGSGEASVLSLRIDVFAAGEKVPFARAIVDPLELQSGAGFLTRPLLASSLRVVGHVTFQYLVVKPFTHAGLGLLQDTAWSANMLIGHRGGGADSNAKFGAHRRTHVKENTLLSLVTASSLGADYVEFDVQLTRDKVPVIHHNFVCELRAGPSLSIAVPLQTLTLSEFKRWSQASLAEATDADVGKKGKLRRPRDDMEVANAGTDARSRRSTLVDSVSSDESTTSHGSRRTTRDDTGDTPLSMVSRARAKAQARRSAKQQFDDGSGQHSSQQQHLLSPLRPSAAGDRRRAAQRGDGGSTTTGVPPPQTTAVLPPGSIVGAGCCGVDDDPENEDTRDADHYHLVPKIDPDHDRSAHKRVPTLIQDVAITLQEAFEGVPLKTGFNIEIKYPADEEAAEHHLTPEERNGYVDTILRTVFTHAGERKIIFSSFDPDVVTMLSVKQPRYPVLLLTNGGGKKFSDLRMNSLQSAVKFARRIGVLGIVTNVEPLVLCPNLIRTIQEAGLLLCTYGKGNNEIAVVKLQQDYGVDGVIVDHVGHVARARFPSAE
jgi:glycerophosphoryl diester phosphodiesterase